MIVEAVMQKILWCDSLYRQKFSTLEIHCQLMMVLGDGVLRSHSSKERVRRVKSGLSSIMKIAPLSPADQENLNTVQVVEVVLENQQHTIPDLFIALE